MHSDAVSITPEAGLNVQITNVRMLMKQCLGRDNALGSGAAVYLAAGLNK